MTRVKNIIEQNRKVYDKIAPLFASTRQYLWDDLNPFLDYLKPNLKVLDLGCGTGRLYHLFAKFQDSIEYVGMDQSEGQLAESRKEFPNNDYVQAEMTKLPFENESFDMIFCIATFHHLPDEETRKQSLEEMNRVLKSGGRVFMTNWNLYSDSAIKTVEKGKWEEKDGEFKVPWMNPEGKVLGERYYYGFALEYLQKIFELSGFVVEENYFSKKGEKSDVKKGNNVVTILKKN
ncbi:MAG: class I SAM-dependent methyltransferase [Candidatus Magasanikbacteria bacterium]